MRFIYRLAWLLLFSMATAACTTAPVPPQSEQDFTIEIVRHVKCELFRSYDKLRWQYDWLSKWRAAFDLTLKIENRGASSLSTGVLAPIHLGVFGLDVGGGYIGSTTRQTQLGIKINLADTNVSMCTDNKSNLVQGDFGIYSWLSNSLQAATEKDKNYIDTLGQYIEFYTEVSGGVSPTIKITRASTRQNSGSGAVSLSRKRTSTLNMAMTEIPTGRPTEVVIVGDRTSADRPGPQGVDATKGKGRTSAPARAGGEKSFFLLNGADQKLDGTLTDQRLQNLQIDR